MAGEENNTSPVCYGCLILLPTDHRHPPPPRRAAVKFQFPSSQKQRNKLGTPVKRRYQRDPRVRSPRFGKGKAKGCSSRSSASFPSRTLQNSRVAEGGRACWEAKDPSLPTHPPPRGALLGAPEQSDLRGMPGTEMGKPGNKT